MDLAQLYSYSEKRACEIDITQWRTKYTNHVLELKYKYCNKNISTTLKFSSVNGTKVLVFNILKYQM